MSMQTGKKTGPPQIAVLDKAIKLAEQWVNNMSKPAQDELTETELEGRPHRLGLGAKVVRQSEVRPSNNPVERKLQAKLEAGKRKAAKGTEESIPSAGNRCNNNEEDDSDEELESRTRVFAKKRADPLTPSLQVKKKQK